MSAAYTELFLEQGTDFNTSITLDDVNGDAYDLTGCLAKSQIRKSYYSKNETEHFNITIQDPTSGIISLNIPSANTVNITPGRYVYDVVIKDTTSGNTVTRVLEGIINVIPQVTVF
jgi:hypothetical protein